jgi:hypothetical protein
MSNYFRCVAAGFRCELVIWAGHGWQRYLREGPIVALSKLLGGRIVTSRRSPKL